MRAPVGRLVDAYLTLDLLALRVRVPRAFDALPLPVTLGRLARHRALFAASPAQIDAAIARVERLWTATSAPRDTCLYRSLSRFALLRSQGHAVAFVMGVYQDHGHAWIEDQGEPVEELDYPYAVTYRYPS